MVCANSSETLSGEQKPEAKLDIVNKLYGIYRLILHYCRTLFHSDTIHTNSATNLPKLPNSRFLKYVKKTSSYHVWITWMKKTVDTNHNNSKCKRFIITLKTSDVEKY